jgi:hypothetical protein
MTTPRILRPMGFAEDGRRDFVGVTPPPAQESTDGCEAVVPIGSITLECW